MPKRIKNPPTMTERVNEWRKRTSVAFTFKWNKETQADVIAKLRSVDNKAGYIASLIRADMEKK